MPNRLLAIHKFLKRKLYSLNLATYDIAENFISTSKKINEQVNIYGQAFELTYFVDTYPPEDEIIIAAFLTRKRIFCNEVFSAGIVINKQNRCMYLSQKSLWDKGF